MCLEVATYFFRPGMSRPILNLYAARPDFNAFVVAQIESCVLVVLSAGVAEDLGDLDEFPARTAHWHYFEVARLRTQVITLGITLSKSLPAFWTSSRSVLTSSEYV